MLRVTSADEDVLEIHAGDGQVEALVGGKRWQMPFEGGEVRVVLDAQAIEISCPGGVLGLVSEPRGDSLLVLAGDVTVYPLAR